MTKYYISPSTLGFYIQGIHSTMPDDVEEITKEEYEDLLAKNAEGLKISWVNGAAQTAAPEISLTWNDVRNKRDSLLSSSDYTQLPDAPFTPEEKQAWTTYRQALREVTNQQVDPSAVVWPSPPGIEQNA